MGDWRDATVNIDYHVVVEYNFYSVPYQLVHQRVEVRLAAATVEIFLKGRRIASHRRRWGRGQFSTDPACHRECKTPHLEEPKIPHPSIARREEMSIENEREAGTIGAEVIPPREVPMVGRERWEEIRRLGLSERKSIAAIARQLELDRKTVRRCLRATEWTAYRRAPRGGTLLAPHAEYLRERASQVNYSAQILFQELRQRGYPGSYDTVKLFVQPLRAAQLGGERALLRFETPPGQQSQIDWGVAMMPFRSRPPQCGHAKTSRAKAWCISAAHVQPWPGLFSPAPSELGAVGSAPARP